MNQLFKWTLCCQFSIMTIYYPPWRYVMIMLLREATKKESKKTTQQVWTISKNGEPPPLPLFHNKFSRFWNLKIKWMIEMTKSLSKISLKSSSKQTDYEKFSSLWTKIWYCGGDVLHGRIFEFSIRSEIRRSRIF